MDEDSSLGEFTTGTTGDDTGAESTGENGGSTRSTEIETDPENSTTDGENSRVGDGSESSTTDSETAVAPTVSTYAYAPGKAACGACGTWVGRRWRDDGKLVCSECKEW